jgi:hypothetical protein
MSTGATDGISLEAIGIPVHGAPGFWTDPNGEGVHGRTEHLSVRAGFTGGDCLTDPIKRYADSEQCPQ